MAAANTEVGVTARSNLACDLCKKKKSRCDRQIPTCSFCQRTANCCTYPTVRLKPGPKLGSTHRRRRLRLNPARMQDVAECDANTSYGGALQDKSRRGSQCLEGRSEDTHSSPENFPSITSSPDTKDSDVAAFNFARAISLSRFLYPSHESSLGSSLVQQERSQPGFLLLLAEAQGNLMKACEVLRTSLHQAQSLIDLFFEMVAGLKSLSIFHQPTFPDKIRAIQDHNHIIALFAAMFSLSSRFLTEDMSSEGENSRISHQEFHTLSLQYIHTSLEACSSSAPPLCLLQAMTLAGYYKLVNGVYGPAWRLVGAGVRIAYELRLHLIDCKGYEKAPTCDSELSAWSLDEERRRCWWALWEMDIFASTIQRAPTAIDWSSNETYLPISDEYWFTNKYQASCLLYGRPEERWKRLKSSGNENSVAWANLLASLMHDGRLLCQENIRGIISDADPQNDVSNLAQYYSQDYRQKTKEFSDRLSTLVRAYQDVRENLPAKLSYRGEYLSFGLVEGEDAFSMRRASAGKYSIHMMSSSACFMIYQNYVFAGIIDGLIPLSFSTLDNGTPERATTSKENTTARKCLRNYLEASDMVLRLLPNCPEDHVRYVNPYYASTIWIAAALQVFKRIALRDKVSILAQRQYALLRRTYLQFKQFWQTPFALLQNLDSLEARLETRQKELELSEEQARNILGNDQRTYGETACSTATETVTSSAWRDQFSHGWPGLKNPQCDTSQPSLNGLNAGCPVLLTEDVEWPPLMDPEFDLSINQAAFSEECTSTWPSELFMGNLAWYSSDVMAGLSHGYTA